MKYSLVLITLVIFQVNAASISPTCGDTPEAQTLFKLILNDASQQRSYIECNPLLVHIAEEKAVAMAEHGLVMHNLGGSPNQRLREAGFELPKYYGAYMSNQVEAIAGGYSSAEKVWRAFKNSEQHRKHLLGEHPVYKRQDKIGIAFVRKNASPHVEYWVVYLTEGTGSEIEHFDDVPNKGIEVLTPEEKVELVY